jgi:hypothetical protein
MSAVFSEEALASVVTKLSPDRLQVSGKFTAILGYILDQRWTDPELTDMCVTSDGLLLGQQEGDIGMNEILGTKEDLGRNLYGVAEAVGLDPLETGELFEAVNSRITDWS